ncbi:MAG: phosphotransferase [Gammaproteobacteria bacterium]|nr:phosphotransferase [Gammaproteobacteria bacterium]
MGKFIDDRFLGLYQWLQTVFPCAEADILPLAGDASFRRYFRVMGKSGTRVAVDAPPAHEKIEAFLGIAKAFTDHGVHVPKIIASDTHQGYMLISDLGDELYSNHLSSTNVDNLYLSAIDALVKIQQTPQSAYSFPAYDEKLLSQECEYFSEWYLGKYLNVKLSAREEAALRSTYSKLIEAALEQPTTVVHRDYHSRNLFILPENEVGVIDFQDAVIGPITYDLVSLLKDCYIAWPASNVVNWAQRYFEKSRDAGIIQDISMSQFLRWFDLMGVQRHLKCMGIFARLFLRDKKSSYVGDIPRLADYILGVCSRHPQLNGLAKLLQTKVMKHESHDTRSRARSSAETIDG